MTNEEADLHVLAILIDAELAICSLLTEDHDADCDISRMSVGKRNQLQALRDQLTDLREAYDDLL